MINAPATSAAVSAVPCRVLIVDDHPAIAHLLADFVRLQPDFAVLGICHDATEARAALAQQRPDLVVLDIGLPETSEGLGLLQEIGQQHPAIKVLVFSAATSMHVARQILLHGAIGFLEKTSPFPEFLTALRNVRHGRVYLGSRVSALLREAVIRGVGKSSFSHHEVMALNLLASGKVIKEIATQLDLSTSMVYKILERLRTRFRARTNEDLIVLAMESGLLQIESRSSSAI